MPRAPRAHEDHSREGSAAPLARRVVANPPRADVNFPTRAEVPRFHPRISRDSARHIERRLRASSPTASTCRASRLSTPGLVVPSSSSGRARRSPPRAVARAAPSPIRIVRSRSVRPSSPSRPDAGRSSAPRRVLCFSPRAPPPRTISSAATTPRTSPSPPVGVQDPLVRGRVDVSSATGVKDAKTFLRILGKQEVAESAGHLPVLCLHGGPGLGSSTWKPARSSPRTSARWPATTSSGARDPRSDPVRAGTFTPNSTPPSSRDSEPSRADKVHIVAHGWGAMLAIDHVLGVDGQRGVGGVASSPSSPFPHVARLVADRRSVVATPPTRRGSPGRRRRFARRQSHPRGEGVVRQGVGGMDRAIRIVARGGGCCGVTVGAAGEGSGASRKTGDEEVAASAVPSSGT